MKTYLSRILLALSVLAAPCPAQADEITGKVIGFNHVERTIALNNGLTFRLSDQVAANGISLGSYVRIEFVVNDGKLYALQVSSLDGGA